MDVRILYAFTFIFVVPPTIMINGKARRVTYRFYRDRFGYGRLRAVWMVYKNHCAFSQVVIDRFAMYAGKRFNIDIDGFDEFRTLSRQPGGFVQLSSHIGNYEIAGYSLPIEEKRMNALVFGGEKASVMANRDNMFKRSNVRMIPMMSDMSHLFKINEALSNGEIISMPSDRVFGSSKCFDLEFMDSTARFPQGAFTLAALRNVPVLYVTVMKSAPKKYHITVHRLENLKNGKTVEKALHLAEQYVKLMEDTVRRHPAQWYNYFDFWSK